ncbi:MAG TPA: glycosyltransferase [Casimicrobiaceae bacterium]|nr:glycosyltransferase [Casimicrobiaceae bacterium]
MSATKHRAIDIVVPIHNAADDLRRCVDSVLAHTSGDYRLLLIDDASTETEVGRCLRDIQSKALPHVALFANETNLGFTLTANRGIQAARPGADVVLLNSDTRVTPEWLDALARCASTDPTIGTITPFSNNAEICSLPRFCENNSWPEGSDPAIMAGALKLAAAPAYPDLPTGVGFCLYIRRALIDAIGSFDPQFGMGYGEENDFCLRATAVGYRNVLCDDAFVLHLGGSSFGDKRRELAQRNMRILLERHPRYLDLVRDFIAADPLKPLRELAAAHYRILTLRLPGVLHIVHGHGGGTEYHVRALTMASREAFRHYLLIAVGQEWQLEEHDDGLLRTYNFPLEPGETPKALLAGICGRFSIDLIHLHNISGSRDALIESVTGISVPYGYTVHDLNFACPTITFLDAQGRYCGAVTERATCQACLRVQDAFSNVDIGEWRRKHGELLDRASFAIAPSQWAAQVLQRYFPRRRVDVVAHGSSTGMGRPDAQSKTVAFVDDGRPVIAVLGAIGPDKGSRRLERLVELTRDRALGLRWVLIGYLDTGRAPWQSEDGVFTMHGPYDSRQLPELFEHYTIRLVAYPSVCPETFSFTLSETWAAGRPAIVPPIGALADRVIETGAGFVLTDEEWHSEDRMLDRIVQVLASENRAAFDAAAECARAAPLPSLTTMAERTVAVYRDALGLAGPSEALDPISARRCLLALGYVPWRLPQTAAPKSDGQINNEGAVAQLASAALRIRHTLPGRVLYRLAPKALVAALKARLPS